MEEKPNASIKILGGFSVAESQGIKIRSRFQEADDQPFPD